MRAQSERQRLVLAIERQLLASLGRRARERASTPARSRFVNSGSDQRRPVTAFSSREMRERLAEVVDE
jgi:hypothetical protein